MVRARRMSTTALSVSCKTHNWRGIVDSSCVEMLVRQLPTANCIGARICATAAIDPHYRGLLAFTVYASPEGGALCQAILFPYAGCGFTKPNAATWRPPA